MGKKAVIFDMDGVIFDTERVYLEIWKSVFEKYGYKMTKELYFSFNSKILLTLLFMCSSLISPL